MAKQTINNGETGLLVRTKINDNFTELYDTIGVTLQTFLTVSGSISAGTILNVLASGVNYVKSGDNGNLGSSSTIFQNDDRIQLYLNGVKVIKQINVIWDSSTTFHILIDLDSGDTITINSIQ